MRRTSVWLLTATVAMLALWPAFTWAAGAGSSGMSSAFVAEFADLAILAGMLVISLLLLWWWRQGFERSMPPRAIFCTWGVLDFLIVAASFIVLYALLGQLVLSLHRPDLLVWLTAAAMGICGLSAVVLILLILHRRYGLWPRDIGLNFDEWPRDLLLAIGLVVFVLAMRFPMSAFFEYLRLRANLPKENQWVVQQMLNVSTPLGLAVMLTVAVVVAPLWEEMVFRGFIQPLLRKYFGGPAALLITAVLFALIHEPKSQFHMMPVMMFPVALALGYCYERTQRLAPCIMLHVLHNGFSVALILLVRSQLVQGPMQ